VGFIWNKALYIKHDRGIFRVRIGREGEQEVGAAEEEGEAQGDEEEHEGDGVRHSGLDHFVRRTAPELAGSATDFGEDDEGDEHDERDQEERHDVRHHAVVGCGEGGGGESFVGGV
jgi:hypothetical protein